MSRRAAPRPAFDRVTANRNEEDTQSPSQPEGTLRNLQEDKYLAIRRPTSRQNASNWTHSIHEIRWI